MISEQIWWIFWWHAISPDSKNVPIESCQIFQDLPVLGLILLAVSWYLAMILCFSFAHLCKFIIHLCLAAEMADSWGWLTHEGWTNMLRVETYTLLDLIADMGNWFLREEGLFHWPYFLVITSTSNSKPDFGKLANRKVNLSISFTFGDINKTILWYRWKTRERSMVKQRFRWFRFYSRVSSCQSRKKTPSKSP